MPEIQLSFSVLEFYCWNPNWDQYLQRMLDERLKNYIENRRGT